MRRSIGPRATFANVTALLALVVALGGSAYSAARINSADLVDDSIKSVDLKDGAAVRSRDVVDAPSGSDAVNADKLDGKSLGGLIVKGRDVTAGQRASSPPPSTEEEFTIARDGSLAVAARCRHGGLFDFWIDVFVRGRRAGTAAPEGTYVATDDGEVERSDNGRFRLMYFLWGDKSLDHVTFSAIAPDGSRLTGLVSGAVMIHGENCIVDYLIFEST